jgi:hypothetical protein
MKTMGQMQELVSEILTRAMGDLPEDYTRDDLREAVERALKSDPDVGPYTTIELDDSYAGFSVRIEIPAIPSAIPLKPNLDLN